MTHDKEVAYISGAISSDPNYKEKFADAQMVLGTLGYAVISPTMIPPILTEDEHMYIDLHLIDVSDTLVLLPDWTQSHGAPIERDHAMRIGKRVVLYCGLETEAPIKNI